MEVHDFKFIYILFFMILLFNITASFLEKYYMKDCEKKKYTKI